MHQLICLSTNKLSTTYVCFPKLKSVFYFIAWFFCDSQSYFYSCSKTLISLWRTAFRYDSFSFVLGGFCSFVHTSSNISESFQRRDWSSLNSSIFCDKTAHMKGVKKNSLRETKLRSREKWENQSMSGLSSSLGFSGLKKYQNICGSKGRWQCSERWMFGCTKVKDDISG